jgi:hypothetical protein
LGEEWELETYITIISRLLVKLEFDHCIGQKSFDAT